MIALRASKLLQLLHVVDEKQFLDTHKKVIDRMMRKDLKKAFDKVKTKLIDLIRNTMLKRIERTEKEKVGQL